MTNHKSVLRTGTTRSREVSARVGVTNDEAENPPRLRVANGEDSQESKPPVKRRARTHTASPQYTSTQVPWRWGSRTGNRRLQGTSYTRSLVLYDFEDRNPAFPVVFGATRTDLSRV